ncbi:hypothetical protein CBL_20693, partial [Carabus blaptoides fortunei]
NKIVETMQENVILHSTTNEMSLDEIRHISTKRLYNLIANQLMIIEKAHANPRIPGHVIRMLFHWDPASSAISCRGGRIQWKSIRITWPGIRGFAWAFSIASVGLR